MQRPTSAQARARLLHTARNQLAEAASPAWTEPPRPATALQHRSQSCFGQSRATPVSAPCRCSATDFRCLCRCQRCSYCPAQSENWRANEREARCGKQECRTRILRTAEPVREMNVVARDGIEPPTPAFSGPRSTTELSGHGAHEGESHRGTRRSALLPSLSLKGPATRVVYRNWRPVTAYSEVTSDRAALEREPLYALPPSCSAAPHRVGSGFAHCSLQDRSLTVANARATTLARGTGGCTPGSPAQLAPGLACHADRVS